MFACVKGKYLVVFWFNSLGMIVRGTRGGVNEVFFSNVIRNFQACSLLQVVDIIFSKFSAAELKKENDAKSLANIVGVYLCKSSDIFSTEISFEALPWRPRVLGENAKRVGQNK